MHGLPRVNFGHFCARHAAALRGGAAVLAAMPGRGENSCRNAALFLLGRARLLESMASLCRGVPAGAVCDVSVLCKCAGQAVSGACIRRDLRPAVQQIGIPLPVAGSPRTLLPAVLSLVRCAMRCGPGPVLCCRADKGRAVLRIRSCGGRCSVPPDQLALACARLLATCGGGQFLRILSPAGGFDVCLILPLCPGAACCPLPAPEALLRDRYSPLFTQLAGLCIPPD